LLPTFTAHLLVSLVRSARSARSRNCREADVAFQRFRHPRSDLVVRPRLNHIVRRFWLLVE
jgi:hypothetical protein